MRPFLVLVLFLGGGCAWAQNPFAPPSATVHYERDREYDLRHVVVSLKVDWPHRQLAGTVTHTLAPVRSGLRFLTFDAGSSLKIRGASVNGSPATFEHKNDKLTVQLVSSPARDVPVSVVIQYATPDRKSGQRSVNGPDYGLTWIEPDKFEPARKPGFLTQGETEGNHHWVPIYDYPNDRATSEEIIEAPAGWWVTGNGTLVGIKENPAPKTRTFHWRMTQPHVTYLLSLAAGEMDVTRDSWNGIDLFYCVPKGEGRLIPASFSDTKDMLQFFSWRFGVKYPWPKYAQTAMFEFGGGMENVSATTLGEGSLVEERNGIRPMAGLNSHELGHQWFGDLVTCRDWGNIWLNEGFATFCEQLYREHSRGKEAYDEDREGALQGYFGESRRYKRPIVTNLYPNPDSMFDSHTYPKGSLILHMLRRILGDDEFFRTLAHYLRSRMYGVVDTQDLIHAFRETTGRNMQAFFDQWVYKPGHPLIDFTWSYDEAAGQVVLDVKQLQDTKDGTPVYSIDLPVAIFNGSGVSIQTVKLNQATQQFKLTASSPQAVVIDPGHDYLIERKDRTWHPGEAEVVVRSAQNYVDRAAAARQLLTGNPSDESVRLVAGFLRTGSSQLIRSILPVLGDGKRESLRADFRALIEHKDPEVGAAAIGALAKLPKDTADIATLEKLLNDRVSFPVVTASLSALGQWDPEGQMSTFERALKIESRGYIVQGAALAAIGNAKTNAAMNVLTAHAAAGQPRAVRAVAIDVLSRTFLDRPTATEALIGLLKDEDPQTRPRVVAALLARKDKTAVAALRTAEKADSDEAIRKAAKDAADKLEALK